VLLVQMGTRALSGPGGESSIGGDCGILKQTISKGAGFNEAKRAAAGSLLLPLAFGVGLDPGMNLTPVHVEHVHGDGSRRPVPVEDKPDRAGDVSRVGGQFPKDVRPAVEELDSELHGPSRAALLMTSAGRFSL
jgi:hypothetical protein